MQTFLAMLTEADLPDVLYAVNAKSLTADRSGILYARLLPKMSKFALCCLTYGLAVWLFKTEAVASRPQGTKNRTASSTAIDQGVDVGTIKKATFLFEAPDVNSRHVEALPKGAITVLVSRTGVNGWTNAIQLSTGHQGWVRTDRISIQFTKHPKPPLSLQAESNGTEAAPIIKIINSSSKTLFLHMQGQPEHVIGAWSNKSIQVPAGILKFNASSPNVIPSFGYRDFIKGSEYVWTFTIKIGGSRTRPNQVSKAQIELSRQLQADVDRLNREVKSLKAQLDLDQESYTQDENRCNEERLDIDSKRRLLDNTDEAAVNAFNRLVEQYNDDLSALERQRTTLNLGVDRYNAKLDELSKARERLHKLEREVNRS